jgi:hypothetical protein
MSTRVRKKEILSDDFKKRKILWKNIAENCPPDITSHNYDQNMPRGLNRALCQRRLTEVHTEIQRTQLHKELMVFAD